MISQGISAVLVAKNEENYIERCLSHLTWADEIIIVDDNSSDRTVEISKKYTNKIYVRQGGNGNPVLDNKNFGFEKATKDWILSIDADEIVTNECKKEILAKIEQSTNDGYYCNFRQTFLGKEFKGPLWTRTQIVRLFKRGKGKYENMCSHFPIKVNGTIGRIESPILHDGYPDIETFVRKMNYYTTLDATLLHNGRKGGLLKKPIKKINYYNLFIEPALFLPYYFFIKKNYKDGLHGLVLSILMTFYLFIERAKQWRLEYEKYHKKSI